MAAAPAELIAFEAAFVHESAVREGLGARSNERLEFLGDAVLGLVVTIHLYRAYPTMPEGELAKVRASVVSSAALAEVAASLGVGDAILLGKGESQSGGRDKPSILADAMEALLAAVYLDRSWSAAEALIMRLLGGRIADAAAGPGGHDYKTRLQELCARHFDQLPVYTVSDDGPDHAKSFEAVVSVNGRVLGRGVGRSKKQAEQGAARLAWEALWDQIPVLVPELGPDDPTADAGGWVDPATPDGLANWRPGAARDR